MDERFDLERFIVAQNAFNSYGEALSEIRGGRKYSHWIWYIFPQIHFRDMHLSAMSEHFAISCAEEAAAYLAYDVLGERIREISGAMLAHADKAPEDILGHVDAMKVHSSMTLFDAVSPDDVFARVLDVFYGGKRDEKTLVELSRSPEDPENRPVPCGA